MPEPSHVIIPNLMDLNPQIQSDSILSRTIFSNDRIKTILFSFAEGQELSEHTAAVPAILHFLEGKAKLTLGKDEYQAVEGTWVQMDAHLPHSVYAITPVVMLLLMIQNPG